jgi:hypothetical protein
LESVFDFLTSLRNRVEKKDSNESTANSTKAQAPYLASIEFIKRLLSKKQLTDHKSNLLEKLKNNFSRYLNMFAAKPGFFYDLIYFKDIINDYSLSDFILNTLKELESQNRPFKSIKSIYTCLSYWQMHRFFGRQKVDANNTKELADLSIQFEEMYKDALPFGKDLLSTGFQYADEFMILSVHIQYDLYKQAELFGGDTLKEHNILRILVNLKHSLKNSPTNYQLKLLMLNLYSHIGAYSSLQSTYESMEIKNIQNLSMSNLLLVHNIRLGASLSAWNVYDLMNSFFTSNLFDMANFLVNCYKYGTFLKAIDICQFMDAMRSSLSLNLCLVNLMSMLMIQHGAPVNDLVQLIPNLKISNHQKSSKETTNDDDFSLNEHLILKSKLEKHSKVALFSLYFKDLPKQQP